MVLILDPEPISNVKYTISGDILCGRGQLGQIGRATVNGAGSDALWTLLPKRPHHAIITFTTPSANRDLLLPRIGRYDQNKAEQGHTVYVKNNTTRPDPFTPYESPPAGTSPILFVKNAGGLLPDPTLSGWTQTDNPSGAPPTSIALRPGESAIFMAMAFDTTDVVGTLDEWYVIGPMGSGAALRDTIPPDPVTLQIAYDNSAGGATPEIILNNSTLNEGLVIRDSAVTPVTGPLFSVESNASVNQLGVTASSVYGLGATLPGTNRSIILGTGSSTTANDVTILGRGTATVAGSTILTDSSAVAVAPTVADSLTMRYAGGSLLSAGNALPGTADTDPHVARTFAKITTTNAAPAATSALVTLNANEGAWVEVRLVAHTNSTAAVTPYTNIYWFQLFASNNAAGTIVTLSSAVPMAAQEQKTLGLSPALITTAAAVVNLSINQASAGSLAGVGDNLTWLVSTVITRFLE